MGTTVLEYALLKYAGKSSLRHRLWGVPGLVILLVATLNVPATALAGVQTKAQQKCITKTSKEVAKVVLLQAEELAGCVKDAGRGKLGALTAQDCLDADRKSKISKASAKLMSLDAKFCGSLGSELPVFGRNDPAVAKLIIIDEAVALMKAVFGVPLEAAIVPPNKKITKCQLLATKGFEKVANAERRVYLKCQKDGLKDGSITSAGTLRECFAVIEADSKGKIAKQVIKLTDQIEKHCPATLASLSTIFPGSSCLAVSGSAETFSPCLANAVDCRVCGATSGSDELAMNCDVIDDGLPNSSCTVGTCGNGSKDALELCDGSDPTPENQVCPNSGGGLQACSTYDCACDCPAFFDFTPDISASESRIDRGWTGVAHGEKWISGATVSVAVGSCDGVSKPCGVCDFVGPVANRDAGEGSIDNQRCLADTSERCASNGDCVSAAAGTDCRFFFGAPLPLTSGGAPLCVVQPFRGDVTGTANVDTGDIVALVNVDWTTYAGITMGQPCPRCVGDMVANDGMQDGLCLGGERTGQACDKNGDSATAGLGPLSLDCPPATAGLLAVLPVNLDSSTGQETESLVSLSPDCSGGLPFPPGSECLCDACSGDTTIACRNDADCSAAGAGTCGGQAVGAPTNPHACSTVIGCEPADGFDGECAADPDDFFCDAVPGLRLPCTTDGDCTAYGSICDDEGCGLCTISQKRACLVGTGTIGDSVDAQGEPDVATSETSNPVLAAVSCVAATGSAPSDFSAGMPGPLRISLGGTARAIPHEPIAGP
ncbi:MAG: hypothetical protein ACI8TX_002061 [Hyphomicrobiaceae bacterium]|jgi:hypothetical protein